MHSRCFSEVTFVIRSHARQYRAVMGIASIACLVLHLSGHWVHAQGAAADYERAAKLRDLTRDKVFKSRVEPRWFAASTKFVYRNRLSGSSTEFIVVDAEVGTRKPAFDQTKLASALKGPLGREVSATDLPIQNVEFIEDGKLLQFQAEKKVWKWELDSEAVTEVGPIPPPENPMPRRGRRPRRERSNRNAESPDGKLATFVRDHNLCLKVLETKEEIVLSTDGTADNAYESAVFWSPDGKRCVALQTRPAQSHPVYLIESSPKDQLQPRLHQHDYLKPGDKIAQSRPQLFDVENRKPMAVSDALFTNPWSIDDFDWSDDSKEFTFHFNQRGHQALRVISINADTGDARAMINEESPTFIDYAHKHFFDLQEETNEIIWMSERDGWNHLYLYDATTGQVKNQITKGNWVVRNVEQVDHEARRIWFRASGVFPGQDPYYIHYGVVGFDGQGLTWLTRGDGTHQIEYSPDKKFLVDTYSRIDLPPVIELRRVSDGELVCELERADWSSLLATGWKVPERFVAPGRDGKTDICGVIYRPTNFDPAKKYPVIEMIYAGPQSSFVPKSFSSFHPPQAMAELGFVVVQMDGMGTSNRSKAFHDVCFKNLGDSGFPDRILWIQAAAKAHPEMDLTRVGIYGGSAGGQSSTRALMAHGDFYHVAVSDCGCHDNRMDKIWWNELWMGYPIGPHYAAQSNVTQAHKLQGKLLLIVGELDRNVDPASTMQVADALIKADKDFDLLIIPGAGHGSAESPYGQRRRQDFFVRHLLGVEPRR